MLSSGPGLLIPHSKTLNLKLQVPPGLLANTRKTKTRKPKKPSTLPETNISPENRPGPQIGKDRIPTIHFQRRAVSFREGKSVAEISQHSSRSSIDLSDFFF